MKKSFVSLLFLLFFEISASHAGWSEEGIISHLSIHSGNAIFASLSSLSASDTQAACSTTNNAGQFGFGLGELYSQPLFSMLLSADMASRPVKVFLTGECIQGRPQINGLKIVDEGRSDIYSWNELGEWGECIPNDGNCGDGIQLQTVECVRNGGAVVANSYCDASTNPESRSCSSACVVEERVDYTNCYAGTNGLCSKTVELSPYVHPDKTISSVAISDFGYGAYPDSHTQTTPCHVRGNMLVSPSEPEDEDVTGIGRKYYTGTAKLDTSKNTLVLTGNSVGWGSCGGGTCGGCLDEVTLTITYE